MLKEPSSYIRFIRAHSELEFEEVVSSFLSASLGPDESVIREPRLGKERPYRPDFLLPEGCKNLHLQAKTLIESVSFLRFDTIKRLVSHFERVDISKGYALWIVYLGASIQHVDSSYLDGRVHVISFEAWLKHFPIDHSEPIKNTNWRKERKERIEDARFEAMRGEVSLFLGAGVSISAGLPSWKNLLLDFIAIQNAKGSIIDYKKVSKDADNSNLIIGRALRKEFKSDHDFEDAVRKALFRSPSHQSDLVDALSDVIDKNFNIVKVITYNFDDVLEQNMKRDYCSITEENRIDPGYFPIYHVHGFLPESPSDPSSRIVFSEEKYHEVYKLSYHWSNIEQLHSLANTTCFFIGLSMKDPNVRRLLDIAKERDKDVYHYSFLCRKDFKDHDTVDKLLLDLHVKVIWYGEHRHLPRFIKQVL